MARILNLPTDICNGSGVGGGRLVGWLPIVSTFLRSHFAHILIMLFPG